jgi:hypothetical protein
MVERITRVSRGATLSRSLAIAALPVLVVCALFGWARPAFAAGPREYTAFVGMGYEFEGNLEQLEQVTSGTAYALRLASDATGTMDTSGAAYVTSGFYETGPLNLSVPAEKWITSVAVASSVPTSTTVGVQYSLDGGPFSNLPEAGSTLLLAHPLHVSSIRLRVTLTSTVPSITPVFSGMKISFYLKKPKPWTPPKSSTKSSGGGTTTGTGGSGGNGITSGASASSDTTGTGGAAAGGGQASDTGSGLVPGGIAQDAVEGIKMNEQQSTPESSVTADAAKTSGTVPSGVTGLGLLFCTGFVWPTVRSLAWHSFSLAPVNRLVAHIAGRSGRHRMEV